MGTIVWATVPSISDDFTDRRITAGARIFRAILAADVDIGHKVSDRGNLKLCLAYDNDPKGAKIAAQTLKNRDDSRIRKLALHIEISQYDTCAACKEDAIAGIFLTQPLGDQKLEQLITCANQKGIIIFSPLEGDVERGVAGGIAVEARVQPYINVKALQNAKIRLKPFFIKVAKKI